MEPVRESDRVCEGNERIPQEMSVQKTAVLLFLFKSAPIPRDILVQPVFLKIKQSKQS
jgi:hypothetical protein